ncbi:hypothetical protein GC175_31810 [bacterium]|nr:hypothetical protein [bacterium]
MTTLAPILLSVFLCFFVFVAACVILLFVAMISIVRKLAPVVFSQREEKGRTRQWRVIDAQPSFRAMPPSSFGE